MSINNSSKVSVHVFIYIIVSGSRWEFLEFQDTLCLCSFFFVNDLSHIPVTNPSDKCPMISLYTFLIDRERISQYHLSLFVFVKGLSVVSSLTFLFLVFNPFLPVYFLSLRKVHLFYRRYSSSSVLPDRSTSLLSSSDTFFSVHIPILPFVPGR